MLRSLVFLALIIWWSCVLVSNTYAILEKLYIVYMAEK